MAEMLDLNYISILVLFVDKNLSSEDYYCFHSQVHFCLISVKKCDFCRVNVLELCDDSNLYTFL